MLLELSELTFIFFLGILDHHRLVRKWTPQSESGGPKRPKPSNVQRQHHVQLRQLCVHDHYSWTIGRKEGKNLIPDGFGRRESIMNSEIEFGLKTRAELIR